MYVMLFFVVVVAAAFVLLSLFGVVGVSALSCCALRGRARCNGVHDWSLHLQEVALIQEPTDSCANLTLSLV